MRLGLGTAPFAEGYGVTNRAAAVAPAEARRILELAARAGMEVVDTAPAHGGAEETLGASWPASASFRVVTKIPPFKAASIGAAEQKALEASLRSSLGRLRLGSVHAVLLHHAPDLLRPGSERLIESLEAFRKDGLLRKWGASVYDAAEIDALTQRWQPGVVQAPYSVLDQRLAVSGHLARLRKAGVEVHARSIFLQGLLLADPAGLPETLAGARRPLAAFRDRARSLGLSPAQAALRFALAAPEPAAVLVGVASAAQLEEHLAACALPEPALEGFRLFGLQDPGVLNPSLWRLPAGFKL